jgi:hypothetical protein
VETRSIHLPTEGSRAKMVEFWTTLVWNYQYGNNTAIIINMRQQEIPLGATGERVHLAGTDTTELQKAV